MINNFEDIIAWQKARELDRIIFTLIQNSLIKSDFALKDQMLRSSGSIMDNIAEGFDRDGNKEFIHSLTISKGSCSELRSQLYRAIDRGYINNNDFDHIKNLSLEVNKIIGGLIKYLAHSTIKGTKFKQPITENSKL